MLTFRYSRGEFPPAPYITTLDGPRQTVQIHNA